MPIRTDLDLSEGMKTALLNALRMNVGGICFVYCHESTRRALVARGLAVREPASRGHRNVLTNAGTEEAERICAETTRPGR